MYSLKYNINNREREFYKLKFFLTKGFMELHM